MKSIEQVITELEGNIKQLLTQNRNLKEKIEEIDQENVHLKERNLAQAEELEEKKKTLKMLKIAGKGGDIDNKEVKLEINDLVKEIDKCITQIDK